MNTSTPRPTNAPQRALTLAAPDSTDTAAALDGMSWDKLLGDGEEPERLIDALLQTIQADLKSWTGATAKILVDHAAKTVTVESRSPAPDGTVVFRTSITLCVYALKTESEGRRLSVLPRIVAGTLLYKGAVPWIVEGGEAQFAGYLQQIQDRLEGLSL